MKNLLLLILSVSILSCAPLSYYQIYDVTPQNSQLKNGNIVFENEQCRISYNLWDKGGNIGFYIYNKTSSDLIFNADQSFFVLNGIANPYYKNRTYTASSENTTGKVYYGTVSKATNSSITSTSGTSTTYTEATKLTVPTKTSILISEYKICTDRYINCDLIKYPTPNKISSITFTQDNSPFNFYNIISYTIDDKTYSINNNFFISKVSNMTYNDVFVKRDTTDCGNKLESAIDVFKISGPTKFYLKYD